MLFIEDFLAPAHETSSSDDGHYQSGGYKNAPNTAKDATGGGKYKAHPRAA